MIVRKRYTITWNAHTLELGERTCIMGIVNVTPDSFSDGGSFFKFDNAVAQGEKLVKDGADIIDIGGESTRPFSDPVSAEEEIRRVVPVIETLAKRTTVPISIDTTKARVARAAIEAGASMINDVSALRIDPELGDVAGEYGLPIILMHMLGTPKTMQIDPAYADLFGEIKKFFENAVQRAAQKGVDHSKIILDPGIGFGKTVAHNLLLIKHLFEFHSLDVPILIGPSRKAFIRRILKKPDEAELNPQSPLVETGTQATVAAAILHGAHIVRVHDVANAMATAKIMDKMIGTS
ncbi:dihydropteroate synthase [Thermodesulfobacteriota bacterium]